MKPYEVHIWSDGERQPSHDLDDPFHTTTVTVGWNIRDWFKMLLRRKREIQVVVKLTAHKPYAVHAVMNALHSDCLGCGTGGQGIHGDHALSMRQDQYLGGTSNG